MDNDFQIKIEIPVNSPLKSDQRNNLLGDFSQIIGQNDGVINSQNYEYVEKRSFEIPLILIASFATSASILSIINSVLGISKNLGPTQNKGEVFVKREDGSYVKVEEGMTADELKKQLEK